MSTHDQCPTTTKGEKRKASKADLAVTPRHVQRINGKASWRSMEDVLDTPAFREHLEREFPGGMAELVTREQQDLALDAELEALAKKDPTVKVGKNFENRRDFLKLMGASMALAGVATVVPGCRRPDHKIYSYGKTVPEDLIPGKPLYYVTAMPRFDGGCEGLMVETHEGRPTKIEGNPLHPMNQGKASLWALASIMSLYDPDRLKNPEFQNPVRGRLEASWDDFRTWAGEHFARFGKDGAHAGGKGLAFLVEKSSSPTRARMRDAVLAKWKDARWIAYSPSESVAEFEGTRMAFGAPMRALPMIDKGKASVIVSLDRNFLQHEAGELAQARGFAATRNLIEGDDPMSRLYCIESQYTATGAAADHRLRLAPSRVSAFALALAKAVMAKLGTGAGADLGALASALDALSIPAGEDIDPVFVRECADDLADQANRGKALVLAGQSQPAAVHALVAALNQALGAVGNTVRYVPVSDEEARDSVSALGDLAKAMAAGQIDTLVCLGTNPLYDAPGDAGMAEAWKKLNASITLSVGASETAQASTWALNGSHFLESWGDVRAIDGTLSPIQPMIAPLYGASMSEIELLALLSGGDMTAKVDGYELVRETWKRTAGAQAGDFETRWRRALHNGVVENSATNAPAPKVKSAADVANSLASLQLGPAPTRDALEVVLAVGNLGDGRLANVGWMQECPQFGTRVVWDNPLLVSPATAVDLGLAPVGFRLLAAKDGKLSKVLSTNPMNAMYTDPKYPTAIVAELTVNGVTVKGPVWIMPGLADNTVVATLGYGRARAGVVGDGVGVNFYPLRRGGAMAFRGASLKATSEREMIVSTQNHWTLDGKDSIMRAIDLPAWRKHAGHVRELMDPTYGTKTRLNLAEEMGELNHTPPNLSIYENPFAGSRGDPDPTNITPGDPNGPKFQRNQPPAFTERPQWAMTIDQSTCTGCGVCIVACQSENNIPVVGKKETAKGREMHWIRVDRYFTGDDFNDPAHCHHQPVACVHCENAPCEVVCPVSATIHGPEGLNYMTYNRCIGTRYCANNCPYKVRRYNWFDYGVTKFNGGYAFKDQLEAVLPDQGGITGSGQHNKINPNLIPPRLREKLDEISKMQKNPDVTVRSRGVMEKCTYCIQRINAAKIDCKLADIKDSQGNYVVPDGFFQTACQQACPSNSIVFGDMLDTTSKVHATRAHARSYALLGYLNTRPRTSHMVRVMNPNPRILAVKDPERLKHIDDPFHYHVPGLDDHGAGHGGDGHGGDGHGAGAGGASHSFFDTGKRREDGGYALSLRVLSSSAGVRA